VQIIATGGVIMATTRTNGIGIYSEITDGPFFPKVVEKVAVAIPRAEIRMYAGAGHVPHVTHPEQYVALATEFIRAA
jgi:pimeloyl-ACP methyl ester carboxylesterase